MVDTKVSTIIFCYPIVEGGTIKNVLKSGELLYRVADWLGGPVFYSEQSYDLIGGGGEGGVRTELPQMSIPREIAHLDRLN